MAQHNPTEEYKRYFRKDFKRRQKGKGGLAPPPNPFGTMQVVDTEAPFDVNGPVMVERPIQGPPNWDQIWNYWTTGKDVYRDIPYYGSPLTKKERRYLRQNGGSLRDVSFLKRLGEGAYGQIWTVSATQNGINVQMACKVIKLIDEGSFQFEHNMDLLLNDMRALRSINHENIVQMKEFISIPDMRSGFPFSTVLVFLELCDGDLAALLDESLPDRLFPEPLCRHWFSQIATGLQFLHDEGMTHLDIKPANILYVYDNDVNRQTKTGNPLDMTFKLGDFGLYKQFLNNSQRFMMKERRGTPKYMATEMKGYISSEFDSRASDVYSLGVTLARSILGRDVFAQCVSNLHQQMVLANNWQTTQLNISPEAARVISAMVNPSNHMRPQLRVLMRYDWITKSITNPRRVRSALIAHTGGFRLPSITRGLAIPAGLVIAIGVIIAFTVLRQRNYF